MMNEPTERDEILAARLRETLERHAEHVDDATRMRLAAAREQALWGKTARQAHPRRVWLWAPLATAASVALIALSLNLRQATEPDEMGYEDLEVVANPVPNEVMAEPEFYAWLPESAELGQEE